MPDPSLLSATGRAMLGELPPRLRGSYDYLAIVHAYAREVDLLEAAIESIRAEFNPSSADSLLGAWETIVKLPPGGAPGSTLDSRRQAVVARLRKQLGQSEGTAWQDAITGILGPSWSYREHDTADPSSPPAGTVQITVPFASGTPQFAEAVQEVREVTPAHLVLNFVSTAVFQLDVSEMDVQNLGD